ncbi:MAG: thioredoxin domain-containing protein [Chloroflexi bacterium]|nr:thioredoxin domain-containing protein [Chloroflexota bacterium]
MTKAQTKFHFSPRQNRAHEINWREWSPEAFQEAKAQDKPILLSLSAVWCHWCHVMDETSYSDPGVISYINEHYVPVRVDNDQRPDINARYNMGGWPTTAFLTPEGELMTGGTYIPPESMLEHLPKIAVQYKSSREEIARKMGEIRQQRAATASPKAEADLSPDIFDNIVRAVAQSYDPVFGGFGEAPKFPHTDSIDLLLYAHRRNRDPDLLHMARKTLEFMSAGGVYDKEWGGYFRYATNRDWSEPHYEKMLEDNVGLLHNLLTLYRITGDEAHAASATGVIDYLDAKLRDPEHGFFYGSQDADEEFYKLPAAEREKLPEPYIDHTFYTSWNALAASAYLEASWTLDRPELREAALQALDFAWENCRRTGDGQTAMYRYYDGSPHVPGLLGDQAYTARALLDAHEASGDSAYLGRAEELARLLLDRFADKDGGGFFDVWEEGDSLGRLAERQKSVQDNAVCAELFIRLHHLTRNQEYRQVAQATLEAFAPSYHTLGYFAAGYAKQVDLLLNPPAEVNIVGAPKDDSVRALHLAALSLDLPYRVVQLLDPERDAARLEALFLPPEPAPAAYVCLGTTCSAPVTDPATLPETIEKMRSSGIQTLE